MKKRIKSLFLLMATIVATLMFSSMAFAADSYQQPAKITGLKQTKAGSSSVEFSWDSQIDCYYSVEYCMDGVTWTEGEEGTSSEAYKGSLTTGKSYYVRVRGYRDDWIYTETEKRVYGPYSDVFEVVTLPNQVEAVSQTDATYDTATFTWTQVDGATHYEIYKSVNGIQVLAGTSNTNSITLTGLGREEFEVAVVPVKKSASGFEAKDSYGKTLYSSDIKLIPSPVANVYISSYWDSLKEVNVAWNGALFADGYQMQVYKGNAKKPMTDITTRDLYYYVKNITAKNYYKVRVRAYTTVNGQIKYGDWSEYTHFAQQTKIELKYTGSSKLRVSWGKVKGATSYSVYMSTRKNGGYKKVKTLKKTSYTVTKFKKKKISKKKTYYVYVVANKKVGKKTVKSNVTECYYLSKRFY